MRTPKPAIDYIRSLYAPEDALLTRIRQSLDAQKLGWQMGAEEGKLLQMLIRLHGAKTIVEIGTLAGYTAIWMARALPDGGHIHTFEKVPEHAAWARDFIAQSDVADKITVYEGDAHERLPQLQLSAPLDMVVIDADKPSYNAYMDWAEANVRRGGLIVADNTLLFGTVYLDEAPERPGKSTWEGMKCFNERLADTSRFFTTMIPTDEGMTVAIKL
jgi:predicted O-methyltransferase YrrM